MKCIYCNKEFKSKRATAKFCSDKCRMAFNYLALNKEEVGVEKDSVDRVSVSTVKDSKSSVTDDTLSPVITDKVLKDYTAQDLYDAIDS